MDDDTTKDDNQPSVSKKESQSATSAQDLYDDRRTEERVDEGAYSDSFTSGSYSARSRIEMAGARLNIQKPCIMKQEIKSPEKKLARRTGRVEKRQKSNTRRAATVRKAPKRKPRRQRLVSASSILTRLSSQCGDRSPGCKFCGHRCCRRRFEYERRRKRVRRKYKRPKRRLVRRIAPRRKIIKFKRGTKEIQVGSRSMMLSPLFVGSNASPADELVKNDSYCEVSPDMIYQSLRRLAMWHHSVETESILSDIKRYYPVNRNEVELLQELEVKLRIAAVVGIVTCVEGNRWCLSCALENRSLQQTHVTKFWELYGDTMTPIRNRDALSQERSVFLENIVNENYDNLDGSVL